MKATWLAVLVLAACTSGESSDEDCPVGSKGCACTDGGSCDDGLVCKSDVCKSPGTSDATLCEASCDAAIAKCSLADSVRQPCVDDCEASQALQPADCLGQWDAALSCQGSASAWTCMEGQAVATACDSERLAHEGCVWNGDHCAELGGSKTAAGACFIECDSDDDCPLGILACPAAGTIWATAYCAVDYDYQSALGCGPEGWRDGTVIGGCELVCSAAGNDSECPPQMHCVAGSVSGQYFCTGV